VADHRRRVTDRGWRRLIRENWYRDVWMLIITGLVALALWNQSDTTREVRSNQQANTQALCAFRGDIQKRYDAGKAFLRSHPNGFAGLSAATLNVSLTNEASTLKALKPLMCP
jgi:hypothetical protein